MADIEFSLPLPPQNQEAEAFYLQGCRERTVEALGQLLPRCRLRWPTEDKVRCEVTLFGYASIKQPFEYLKKTLDAVGEVLWSKESLPLITVDQVVGTPGEVSPRILLRITRRKLLSRGAGTHYEW